jgi:hypothetical protein
MISVRCICNYFRLLTGWASGHFGWFGLIAEQVEKPILNYIGVAIACVSGIIFLAIRTTRHNQISSDIANEQQPILQSSETILSSEELPSTSTNETTLPSTIYRRVMGCAIAIFAGVLFGLIFIPITYIQDHPYGIYQSASKNGLDYVYAMYSGIFISSACYYLVYIVYKRNRPYLHVQSILSAIISGIMWGIAQAGFLVANSVLSQAISFPLVTIGPGTIAILWSVFYFNEITGYRNYLIIISGTLLRILAATLVVLSKPVPR